MIVGEKLVGAPYVFQLRGPRLGAVQSTVSAQFTSS